MPEKSQASSVLANRRGRLSEAKQALLQQRLAAGARSNDSARITRRPDPSRAPLSLAQRRLWFLHQLYPESTSYNESILLHIQGDLDFDCLVRAFLEIARRHEILRTTFPSVNGEPEQFIHPEPHPGAVPELVDLRALPESRREAEALLRAREYAARPFDVNAGPLMRTAVFRSGERKYLLAQIMHHLVSDGWSMGIFLREAASLYSAFTQGRPSPLPPLPLQFPDFAHWQQTLVASALDRQLDFWKQHLQGAPPLLELPADYRRSPVQKGRGRQVPLSISRDVCERLERLGKAEGCTLFMTTLASFQVLLSRYSSSEDIVVGCPIAGRTRPELEPLIGFFVNTLALRTDLAGDPTFRALLGRVRSIAMNAFENQDVPFERVVEESQPPRIPGCTPVIQVMFAFENFPVTGDALPGLAIEKSELPGETAKLDLMMVLRESRGSFDGLLELDGLLEYDVDLFTDATVAGMARHFEYLLSEAAAMPDIPVGDLQFAPQITAQVPPDPVDEYISITQLFDAQVERAPDAVGVSHGAKQLTYRELDRMASRIANSLHVECGTPVAVFAPQSPLTVAAILGVFKSRGIYVPIDEAQPRHRIASILADARPGALLVHRDLMHLLPETAIPIIDLEELEGTSASPFHNQPGPGDAAYIIYTSGSTGEPKGVVLEHGSLSTHSRTMASAFGLTPKDRVLQFASPAFDVSLEEIVPPLLCGAEVVIRPREMVPPLEFLRYIVHAGVTVLNAPTAWWSHAVRGWSEGGHKLEVGNLRLVIVGGEAMRPEDVGAWFNLSLPPIQLLNAYGPTEATISATVRRIDPECGRRRVVPIGQPLSGRTAHIMDQRCQPVPAGVPGELYLGGLLARGYWNRPDLTAERFSGGLYRTGDRARELADGDIEFLGRGDEQIKIRGFRIEPGEIEAALRRYPGLSQVAVVARERAPGEQRLQAYYVLASGASPPTDAELRTFLQARLPAYMIPLGFTALDRFPMTPGGKIDRRALPELPAGPLDPHLASRDTAEEMLRGIWSDLLGVEAVTTHRNFFEMGGHSLLAARLVSRVREVFQRDVPLRMLFEYPTVAGLAESLRTISRERSGLRTAPVQPVPRGGPLPLSIAQEEFWSFDHTSPGTPLFNVHTSARLYGEVDEQAFANTFGALVARHEALRTSFAVLEGRPVQVVGDPKPFDLDVYDLRGETAEHRGVLLSKIVAEYKLQRFDLGQAPLLHVALVQVAPQESVVLLTAHHIIFDGESLEILSQEFAMLYPGVSRGEPVPLPRVPVQYGDYSLWQREVMQGDYLENMLRYWRTTLGGELAPLRLPTDRPRPVQRSFRYGRRRERVPEALMLRLRELGRKEGATLFMMMLAGVKALLHLCTGQDDIRVGTMSAGRSRPELDGTVGLFANTLLLRSNLSGDPTFREVLHRVRRSALDAADYQDIPFEMILAALPFEQPTDRASLFQVFLLFEAARPPLNGLAGLTVAPFIEPESGVEVLFSTFDLIFEVSEEPGSVLLKFDADLYHTHAAEALLRGLIQVLEAGVANPTRRLSNVDVRVTVAQGGA